MPLLTQAGSRKTSSGPVSQDGVSQQHGATPLFIPKFNHLSTQAILWGEDSSEAGPTIPTHHRITHQILQHCQTFRDLKQTFAVSCRAEQLRLRVQQRVVVTTDDSVLRRKLTLSHRRKTTLGVTCGSRQ